MSDLTSKGEELVKTWLAAKKRVELVRADLEKALRELQTSEERLAIWLLPDDAKCDEKYCVWYGDSLISAQEKEDNYEVSIRKRGKSILISL